MTSPVAGRLAYGTETHTRVRQLIRDRIELSERARTKRHETWIASEDDFKAYIPAKLEDQRRDADRGVGGTQYTTLAVPHAYASLMAAHTYWTSVFFSRRPVFQFTSRHGPGQHGAPALESVLDYQVGVGTMMPALFVWLLDVGKYGEGILWSYWHTEKKVIAHMETEEVFDEETGLPLEGRTREVMVREELTGYKGNKVFNVRPYDFLPDPRVSLMNFQQGEFVGRVTYEGWNQVLKSDYFNMERLKDIKSTGRDTSEEAVGSERVQLPERGETTSETFHGSRLNNKGSTKIHEMFVELVPADWKLGPETYPEKWFFKLAEKDVIISAEPYGHYHNEYPCDVITNEVDGYGLDPRGILEIAKPVNQAMEWLLNSHFFNIRRALNDQIVVDPSRVRVRDLTDGGPGKVIRLRAAGFGTNWREAVGQLPIQDVTGSHLKDMQALSDLMSRVLGVNDNIMGQVNPGGRKTATEIRTSSTFGVNRLKTQAEHFSVMGFDRLSQKLIANTQQFYDDEQLFRVAGSSASNLQFVEVTPESLAGAFDFVPVDGTLPIDRFAQAALWKDVLMSVASIPQLSMQYDLGGIFAWMSSQLLGLKNIDAFKIQSQDPAAIAQQVQQGNLVPSGGPNGGSAPGVGTPSVPTS